MPLDLTKIQYTKLNSRQKETYNYQKISAALADYGFVTLRLSDDWQGADFIAQHIDGHTFMRVQLKSRLTLCRKYENKNIHIAFRRRDRWYLYPHDELLKTLDKKYKIKSSALWEKGEELSYKSLSKPLFQIIDEYLIENPQMKLILRDSS